MERVQVDAKTLEIVAAFEQCTLTELDHEAHVRVAWYYSTCSPLPRVLEKLSHGLRRYAASKGHAEKYHETITFAFACVVHQRTVESLARTWEAFATTHRDLFTRSFLERYYSPETLASSRARRTFVLPESSRQR